MTGEPHSLVSLFLLSLITKPMEIITRVQYENACEVIDDVAGTVSVWHKTEDDAARLFPDDEYIAHLRWLADYVRNDFQEIEYSPKELFERCVMEVVELLDSDGSLYLKQYRSFLFHNQQILFAINRHLGMCWIFDCHVEEAVRRKRSRRK